MEDKNFEVLVKKYFHVIEEMGGVLVISQPSLVRYEKNDVFVEIFSGSYDKEVGIHFGQLSAGKQPKRIIDFALVLQSERPDLARDLGDLVAPDEQTLQIFLSKLAKAFQPFAERIVNHDKEFFERVSQLKFWNV